MNCVFSTTWSQARRAWVVASELANRRGKGGGAIDKRKALCKLVLRCVAVEGLPPAWPLRLGILLTLLALSPPARAVDYYWDIDGATAGAGGATPGGTWSAGGTTLSTDANGAAAATAVTTTTADRLIFSAGTNATGAYTVTVSGTQNIGRLTFQEGTANLTGGTINFGSASGLIEGDATPDTVSSVITGTNGVRFSGGTVTLTGTNTFTGSAVLGGALTQGTVILAAPGGNAISGSFLQMGSGNQSTRGGTVTLGAAEQISDTATLTMGSGHFSGSSLFSLNGFNETLGGINLTHFGEASGVTVRNGAATDATLTLTGSGTYTTASGDRTFGRSIQNGGAGRLHIVVALTGAGMQTFAGTAPSYTGNTTVNSGTLQLWNTALWASNAILNGGTLRLHQTSAGTGNLAGAATRTHANTISGTGGTLRKTGDGTIILSGANTYQGATAIDAGTLRAGSATAFGNSSAVTLANVAGATMDLNNFNISIGSLAGGGTTGGNATLGSGTLTTGGNDTSTIYGGVISGTGALVKTGTGTQTLTGASTYTAGTTIASGTLQLGDDGATGSIVGDVVNDGVLAFKRSDTFTFGGVVSGTGSLSQVGSGTTALTSANSYTGGTAIDAGVLQISSDANLGNAAGGLSFDGGTLQNTAAFSAARAVALNAGGGTFQTDANLALSGAISGTGELRKTGGEALVLTAANTYTGGTTISAGTFQLGNGGTSGSFVGNVVNNGTLAFNRSDTLSFGGVISGSGAVNQIGAGTTILTAGSTYTGTTTISAGTLQLGNGGTSGSIVGNVVNNATLAFNRSDTLSLGGTISGSGAVSQIGAGTTVLTGASTYTGGTTIANGTLQLGNGGTSGSIVGNVVNNATLAFNRSDTPSFGGVISGAGAIRQIGSGVTNLTGNSAAFTGTTSVEAGALAVNGRLCGTLNVLSGGRLQGTGRVCDTTNFTGGTVAPGNSIGILSVNGNFAQLTGSTYEVEVDPASTASDLIHVSGSARIGAGARLEVVRVGATNYNVGTRYTVLTADGGVTGTYSLAGDTQSAFARLTDSYDANHVYLTPEKFRNITDAAGTPNEAAVGAALDSLPGSNGLANAVTWLPNDFAARDALNQLSADIHASTKTALLEDSRFVREAAIDRLRGAACAPGSAAASPTQPPQQVRASCTPEDRQKHSAWAHVFGSWGSIDGDGNAAKLKRDIGGFMFGADTSVGAGWRVGALGGYSRASADTSARNSSSKSDSYHLGAYGGTQWGATALRLGASQSWNKTETNRSVAFAGFAGGLDAEYDSTTTQVFGELGHRIDIGRAILEPFAGLAHVRLRSDAFLERGGSAAMYGERGSTKATFSTIGLRASMQVSESTRLRGMLGWRHAFGDTTPTSTHTFSSSLPFTLAGVPLAKNVAVLEAGIETQLRQSLTLRGSYSGQFGDGLKDHGFKASLNWTF